MDDIQGTIEVLFNGDWKAVMNFSDVVVNNPNLYPIFGYKFGRRGFPQPHDSNVDFCNICDGTYHREVYQDVLSNECQHYV